MPIIRYVDKGTIVCPPSGIQPSHENAEIINTCNSMADTHLIKLSKRSQTKKSAHCVIPFTQNSRKCKLMYSDIKQVSGDLVTGWQKVELQRSMQNPSRTSVPLFMVVVLSWTCTYVRTCQLNYLLQICARSVCSPFLNKSVFKRYQWQNLVERPLQLIVCLKQVAEPLVS